MMYLNRLPQLSTLRWLVYGSLAISIMTIVIIETSVPRELRRRRLVVEFKNVCCTVWEDGRTTTTHSFKAVLRINPDGFVLWISDESSYTFSFNANSEVTGKFDRYASSVSLNLQSDTRYRVYIYSFPDKPTAQEAFNMLQENIGKCKSIRPNTANATSIPRIHKGIEMKYFPRGYDWETHQPSGTGRTKIVKVSEEKGVKTLHLLTPIQTYSDGGPLEWPLRAALRKAETDSACNTIEVWKEGSEAPRYLQPTDPNADLDAILKHLNAPHDVASS